MRFVVWLVSACIYYFYGRKHSRLQMAHQRR